MIRNADGTLTEGGWQQSVRAWVDTGVTTGNMELAVIETHGDKFLLGNDWLTRYRPTINWEDGIISTKYGETSIIGAKSNLTVARRKYPK